MADLAVVLRPRYHFAARPGVFFQRAPYKNHAAKPTSKMSHVTRFVSLGPVSEVRPYVWNMCTCVFTLTYEYRDLS